MESWLTGLRRNSKGRLDPKAKSDCNIAQHNRQCDEDTLEATRIDSWTTQYLYSFSVAIILANIDSSTKAVRILGKLIQLAVLDETYSMDLQCQWGIGDVMSFFYQRTCCICISPGFSSNPIQNGAGMLDIVTAQSFANNELLPGGSWKYMMWINQLVLKMESSQVTIMRSIPELYAIIDNIGLHARFTIFKYLVKELLLRALIIDYCLSWNFRL